MALCRQTSDGVAFRLYLVHAAAKGNNRKNGGSPVGNQRNNPKLVVCRNRRYAQLTAHPVTLVVTPPCHPLRGCVPHGNRFQTANPTSMWARMDTGPAHDSWLAGQCQRLNTDRGNHSGCRRKGCKATRDCSNT